MVVAAAEGTIAPPGLESISSTVSPRPGALAPWLLTVAPAGLGVEATGRHSPTGDVLRPGRERSALG